MVSIDNVLWVEQIKTIIYICKNMYKCTYHHKQLYIMALVFGGWQGQQTGVCVIIIVLETNTRGSPPLHVGLHCVLNRFTQQK